MIGRWKLKPDQWAGEQIIGDRDTQQDAFHTETIETQDGKPLLALILADGMGGHKGGMEAAVNAVSAAMHSLREAPIEDSNARLLEALEAANFAVRTAKLSKDESFSTMGCTLVILLLSSKGAEWVSVGDSPLWLMRNGSLLRLNRDHSMAPVLEFMVQNGEITEEDAADDPRRHMLRSALMGKEEISLIDESEAPVPLNPGDSLVLASDGLLGLTENEIVSTLQSSDDAAAICAQLLHMVRNAVPAGLDNSSVVVYTERKRGWL